jgi:methanogenic corrinoid protein MtbC1
MAAEALSLLEATHEELAASALTKLRDLEPSLSGDGVLRDLRLHLRHVAEAIAYEEPRLFRDYRAWFTTTSAHHGTPPEVVKGAFRSLEHAVLERIPGSALFLAECFDDRPVTLPGLDAGFPPGGPLGDLARDFLEAILHGDRMRASRMVLDAVGEEGHDVQDVYLRLFQPVLRELGRLWQTGRIGVGEEHLATAITQLVMSQLAAHVMTPGKNGGVVVLASVSGELHDVGIRMVSDFLEMEGWETFCVGASVPPESLIQMVVDRRAHVLALSATLMLHLRRVSELIARMKARRGSVKVLVGGHPFNLAPSLAHRVGADAFARDAADAVAAAARLTA